MLTYQTTDPPLKVVYRKSVANENIAQRFLSVDPLAEERTWLTPYNYVQNNPIMRTDPTGALDDWHYDVDDDGNQQLVADKGDNISTFSTQFGVSLAEAYNNLSENGFSDYLLKGEDPNGVPLFGNLEIPEGTSGAVSQFLKVDIVNATEEQVMDQLLFGFRNEGFKGSNTLSYTDYFKNVPSTFAARSRFSGFAKFGGNKEPVQWDGFITTSGSYGTISTNPMQGTRWSKNGTTLQPLEFRNSGGTDGGNHAIPGALLQYPANNQEFRKYYFGK